MAGEGRKAGEATRASARASHAEAGAHLYMLRVRGVEWVSIAIGDEGKSRAQSCERRGERHRGKRGRRHARVFSGARTPARISGCKMGTCPTTSHFCPCGLDICPPYLGFPLRRTDLPQILYHDMDRPSLPWKIIFCLLTCVVLSVSLQEFSVVQERFIPPLLPNLVLPELAERWRFSPPSRDLSAN